jgi:hypothetical protein
VLGPQIAVGIDDSTCAGTLVDQIAVRNPAGIRKLIDQAASSP